MAAPRLEVAVIFRRHGDTYLAAHAGRLSLGQLKVVSAIRACRTAALGGHVAHCDASAVQPERTAPTQRQLKALFGCVLFGLGVRNVVSLPPLIAQQEFRAADVGTVVALVVAFNQAVFAVAPAVLGVLRDTSTSYVAPFALAAALQIVAALIVLIRPPRGSASE